MFGYDHHMKSGEAQHPLANLGEKLPTKYRLVCSCGASLSLLGREDRHYGGPGCQIIRRVSTTWFKHDEVVFWGCACTRPSCGLAWRVDSRDLSDGRANGQRSIAIDSLPSAEPWPAFGDDPLRDEAWTKSMADQFVRAHRAMKAAAEKTRAHDSGLIPRTPTITERLRKAPQ